MVDDFARKFVELSKLVPDLDAALKYEKEQTQSLRKENKKLQDEVVTVESRLKKDLEVLREHDKKLLADKDAEILGLQQDLQREREKSTAAEAKVTAGIVALSVIAAFKKEWVEKAGDFIKAMMKNKKPLVK